MSKKITRDQLLDRELSIIRDYAVRNRLTITQVRAFFSIGIAARRMLSDANRKSDASSAREGMRRALKRNS